VHGVTVMNRHAVDNPILRERYRIRILELDFGQKFEDLGKVTMWKLFRMFLFSFRLLFALISSRPQIVYFTIVPTGKIFYRDAVFGMLVKLFNNKIIFHLHGKGIREDAQKSGFKKWLYRKLFKGSNVICLSNLLKQDIADVHTGAIYVLPNGIATKYNGQMILKDEQPMILYLSNLLKNKGIQVFLNSLLKLHEKNIPFRAKIVGEAYDLSYQEAKDFAEANGLNGLIEIPGPKFGLEKDLILSQSDIFVLPSFNECFPLSILEAMQAGLPVVSTNVGGIPDMIEHGKQGLLSRPNDVDDLTEKILQLLENAALRKCLGENARQKFENCYTIEIFNHGLAGIFEEINRQ